MRGRACHAAGLARPKPTTCAGITGAAGEFEQIDERSKEKGISFDEAIETFLDEERPTPELHRRGKPEAVAATMVYLCSMQASFINGANVRADGGSVASV